MSRIGLVGLLVLVAACGGDQQRATTRVDSAGVEIVTYAGPDVPLAWSFDSLFALGGADSGPQAFYQLRGGLVGADAGGNLYVLDEGAKHIVVFDSTGALVRTMGREGGGPGEMKWPITLVVAPDGRSAAYDMGTGRLVWFGSDGAIGDLVSLKGLYNGGTIRATANGLLLPSRTWSDSPDEPGRDELLSIAGGDTARLVSKPSAGKAITLKSCGMSISGVSVIFAPSVRWAAAGDRVAATTVTDYEIMLLTGRDTTHILRRPLKPEVATAEAAAKQVGDRFRVASSSAGEIVCKTDEVVSELGFADRIPIIAEIAAGPDSTWWVRRRPAAGTDVYAADGEYVGTLPGSAPFPLLALPGHRIASIVTDDLDVQRLVLYRVRMNGS